MEYAYKFRIYPNRQQREQIACTLGCCRFVYNHYLAMRKDTYEQEKKTLSYYDCANDLTQLKKSFEWLQEADSTALQSSLRDLDNAYRNFSAKAKPPEIPDIRNLRASTTTGRNTGASAWEPTSKCLKKRFSFRSLAK